MTYEEFEKLNIYKQRELIEKSKTKRKKEKVRIMIGSGENALFTKVKRGKKVMIEGGTIIKAGSTPKEYHNEKTKQLKKIK